MGRGVWRGVPGRRRQGWADRVLGSEGALSPAWMVEEGVGCSLHVLTLHPSLQQVIGGGGMKMDWGPLATPNPRPMMCPSRVPCQLPPGWLVLQEMNRGGCKLLTDVLRASNGHPRKPSAYPLGENNNKACSHSSSWSPVSREEQGSMKEIGRVC